MKNKLLQLVVMFGKISVYFLVLGALLLNTLMANEGNAQRVQSVKEATITLELADASLEQAFRAIEKNSVFVFVFNKKTLDDNVRLNVSADDRTVESILLEISEKAGVGFRQVNNSISVRNYQTKQIEVIIQETEVSGQITDETGMGLPGATILVKGTTNGTVTDMDGNFKLIVSDTDNTVLTVSFVGYVSQDVTLRGQTQVNVALDPDINSLEEVVVVGYGSIEKKDLTGAVASVGNRELMKVGATSPMGALQTNAAGVNITPRTGSVGAGFDIEIRGANSIVDDPSVVNNSPLFVVDGIMTDNIDFLNPNDIERIDILKDASSTAIYGSRGSRGVVIVSTKTGQGARNQKTSISYSGFVGVRTISNMPDFLNTYDESVQWNRDRQNSRDLVEGNPVVDSDTYSFPTVTTADGDDYWATHLGNRNGHDWLDEFLKPAVQQNHWISASGGGQNASYVVGFGYQGDNGNARGQYFDKYNFKLSVDARPHEMFSIGSNINLAYSEQELVSRQGYTQQLFRMPSYAPAYDEEGEIIQSPMIGISGNVSPYTFMNGGSNWNVEKYVVLSNFYLKFRPIDGLTLSTTFSPNLNFQRDGEYKDRLATRSISVARMWHYNTISFVWDNQLNYTKEFGNHKLSYDFIQSALLDREEYDYEYGRNPPFKSQWYNTGSAPDNYSETGYTKETLMSFTNRLNYSFKDRYMFTATIRWDGSSKLSPGNKWDYFPSAAVAWRASEEPFMSSSSVVNNLKLRMSLGYSGNTIGRPYTTQSTTDRQAPYDWDGTTSNGFIPSELSNDELTWEKTRELNFGIDYGFFTNRISGEINIYDRLSTDLIMQRRLAMPSGWEVMWDNVGSASNKGVEVQLKTVNIDQGDFTWETTFLYSKNTNKIEKLYGKKVDDVGNQWFIGQPVNVVYAMVFDGIWQADDNYASEAEKQELEGTAKVKDLNGDGVISAQDDMKILGSPNPDWIGTFSTTFRYKNWDLSATVYTKQGMLQYSPFHREFTDFNSRVILDVPYYKRDGMLSGPRYSNTYPQPSYMGEYYGEDAEDYGYPGYNKNTSFVRVQNITLGYNFSPKVISKLKMSEMRVYFNALNPFVFTKYDGFDPEWAGAGMSGVDANNTSFSVYQIGLNLKF